MAQDEVPAWQSMTGEQIRRWEEMLAGLVGILPAGPASAVVDGPTGQARILADRLTAAVRATGRPCARLAAEAARPHSPALRTVAVADGPRWRARPPNGGWDLVIWLRTPPAPDTADGEAEHGADVIVDLHDPAWPVIRHVVAHLAGRGRWYLTESRAFFGTKAATWDAKFGEDLPAYAAAVAEAGIAAGSVAVDVGCGTGRALPPLRDAVGPHGVVVGLDLTPQMLAHARARGRTARAALLLADAARLPLADGSVDAVFAAGLVAHLPDLTAGLAELARVARVGGRLVIFQPSGRAALAARHGRTLRPDEPLDNARLAPRLAAAGWQLTAYDDPPHRFLALATRTAARRVTGAAAP